MAGDVASRAARSASILSAMRCGEHVPFSLVDDEFRIGEQATVSPGTTVGFLWLQPQRRVLLQVSAPDPGLLYFLAVWLDVWMPVFPALEPLQYAQTAVRRAA